MCYVKAISVGDRGEIARKKRRREIKEEKVNTNKCESRSELHEKRKRKSSADR